MAHETNWMRTRIAAGAVALFAAGALSASVTLPATLPAYADEPVEELEQTAPAASLKVAVDGSYNEVDSTALFEAVNAARATNGLEPLAVDSALAAYAQTRAAERAFDPNLEGVRPNGDTLDQIKIYEWSVASNDTDITPAQLLQRLDDARIAFETDPASAAAQPWVELTQREAVGIASFTAQGITSLVVVCGAASDDEVEAPTLAETGLPALVPVLVSTDTISIVGPSTSLALTLGDDEVSSASLGYTALYRTEVPVNLADAHWTSGNPEVVSVDGLTASAVGEGTSTLSLVASDITLYRIDVSCTAAIVGYGFGEELAHETSVDVACATSPDDVMALLPTSATVALSSHTTREAAVSWDTESLTAEALRNPSTAIPLTGHVQDCGEVYATVNVGTDFVTGVDAPAGEPSCLRGDRAELPATTSVHWASGLTTDEPITWDVPDEAWLSQGDGFYANGIVFVDEETYTVTVYVRLAVPAVDEEVPSGSGDLDDEASGTVPAPGTPDTVTTPPTGSQAPAGTSDPNTQEPLDTDPDPDADSAIVSFENPPTLYVMVGSTDWKPASTIAVLYDDGNTGEVIAQWNDYATAEPGIDGTLVLTCPIQVGDTQQTAVQTVQFLRGQEQNITFDLLVGDAAPELQEAISCWYNEELGKIWVPVIWSDFPEGVLDDEGRFAIPGTFTLQGTLPAYLEPVLMTFNISEPQKTPTIVAVEPVNTSTSVGTAPVLPSTVNASWSDGSVSVENVVWDAIDTMSYAQAGMFTVSGTLSSDELAKATCTVTVEAPAATPLSVEPVPNVATEAGVAPQLPPTVGVRLSDNSVQQLEVLWNDIDESSYHNGGSFAVNGTVVGTDLVTRVTIDVASPRVTGVQNNLGVQTSKGVAPKLPETASVRWSNGDVTNEKVTWSAVDAALYAQVGTFNVSGTVMGYSVPCTVTVLDQVAKTGDAVSSTVAVAAVGVVVGVAVVAAAIALIVRNRKRRG